MSFHKHLPTQYSLDALKAWAASTDPLHPAMLFCAVMSFLVWIVGELTGNVSQVDRLWTFLPIIYSAYFTYWPRLQGNDLSERMVLVLCLQLLWSARLSINTYRRGFFNPKTEDYRWEYVRAKIPVWAWKLLNLTFIAIIQNVLLMAVELPQYLLLTLHLSSAGSTKINTADYALASLFVLTLAVEMAADQQQQNYQSLKRRALDKGAGSRSEKEQAAVQRGFVTGGLWSYSRHPNFACEVFTWWVLYAFTVVPFLPSSVPSTLLAHARTSHLGLDFLPFLPTSVDEVRALVPTKEAVLRGVHWARIHARQHEGVWWNYSIWGPISMTALFYSSTDLTERISSEKYPLYKQYQRRVGMFWPPITTLKGFWLFVTGRLGKVERAVFGIGSDSQGKIKKL